jgi:predicted RNase H-like nuclease
VRTQNAACYIPFQGRTSERSTCKNAPAAAEHTFISAPAHKHTHAHTHTHTAALAKKSSLLSRADQSVPIWPRRRSALESCDATERFFTTNYELEHVSRPEMQRTRREIAWGGRKADEKTARDGLNGPFTLCRQQQHTHCIL